MAYNYSMKYLFDVNPGNIMFSASDIGWIVGHKFIVYGPLIRGATTVLYEGKPVGTPDASVFPRLIEKHKIDHLYLAPTAVRAIKKDDNDGSLIKNHDISSLKGIHLAGERCDPDTIKWLQTNYPDVLVNDNWW